MIFGLIIRNLFYIPDWLKPAIQSEFYIKIGVVCLGATIMISDVLKSGAMGLLQAVVIVTVVWFFAYIISRKPFKVERATAMTLSTLFFSLAFVCIGLDNRLKDIVSRENRSTLFAFLTAQCFNIVATFVVTWLFFGVVKPLLG